MLGHIVVLSFLGDASHMKTKFYYVYVLLSNKDNGWYTGYTTDLGRRLREHNDGESKSTRFRKPLELIYFEGYRSKKDALGREKLLKSGSGRRYIKKQLRNFLWCHSAT